MNYFGIFIFASGILFWFILLVHIVIYIVDYISKDNKHNCASIYDLKTHEYRINLLWDCVYEKIEGAHIDRILRLEKKVFKKKKGRHNA